MELMHARIGAVAVVLCACSTSRKLREPSPDDAHLPAVDDGAAWATPASTAELDRQTRSVERGGNRVASALHHSEGVLLVFDPTARVELDARFDADLAEDRAQRVTGELVRQDTRWERFRPWSADNVGWYWL
jgi:hypothetical protein